MEPTTCSVLCGEGNEIKTGDSIGIQTIQNQNYGIKSSVVLSLLESRGIRLAKQNQGKSQKIAYEMLLTPGIKTDMFSSFFLKLI